MTAISKIYNKSSQHFKEVKHISIIKNKINAIFKEISGKSDEYSHIFTMVIKAKELIEEYELKHKQD